MRDLDQLAAVYTDGDFRSALVDVFSLSAIASRSVSADGLARLSEVEDAIVLTAEGQRAVQGAAEHVELDEAELKIAAFLSFYWDEPYVDVVNTDAAAIAARMDSLVREGALRYPWLYGRLIDEVYLVRFGEFRFQLDEDGTSVLVGELPQGVWQIGPFVTGRNGLLRSSDLRWLAPGGVGPMLGCNDPGCDALHSVSLSESSSAIRDARGVIDEAAAENSGEEDPSSWPGFVRDLMLDKGGDYHHDDLNPSALAPWLPNALSTAELRVVLSVVLRAYPGEIEGRLPGEGAIAGLTTGAPEEVTAELDEADCLQALLLVTDAALVASIERALDEGKLVIPPTEVRTPVIVRGGIYNGMYDVTCELGTAGMRFRPRAWPPSVAMRLRRLIAEIYSGSDGERQLEWKLRGREGGHVEEKLDGYLAEVSPETAVRELLFESRDRLEASFARLRWGQFAIPASEEDEERLLRRILWKLGVDVFDFPPMMPVFWERLETLRTVARELSQPYGETEREALRGPGTNLFVSLEDVLERAICFAAWALLYDHWSAGRRNRFVYTPQRARSFAASLFNGQRLGPGETLEFSADSKNTLFPLQAAFGLLARECERVLSRDRRRFKRPTSDLPHWDFGLEQFPFLHVHPLLDLQREAAEGVVAQLRQVPATLDRGGVLDVRNRLPHNREPFPSCDEIERAAVAIGEVVSAIESLGISAMPFLFDSERSDRFGRAVAVLVDYRGRPFEIPEPSPLRMTEMPTTAVPQLILRMARIAGGSEVLRFRYREDSEYLERWVGFPNRAEVPDVADEQH